VPAVAGREHDANASALYVVGGVMQSGLEGRAGGCGRSVKQCVVLTRLGNISKSPTIS
jgi:hypothetical protein